MARILDDRPHNLVGRKVREYRIRNGMSQKDLSERLETKAVYVCRGSISRIEDGTRTVTDGELFALAEVLGVGVQDLFCNAKN